MEFRCSTCVCFSNAKKPKERYMKLYETGTCSRCGNVNRGLRSTKEFDFTLFLGSYFSRTYSHRAYLILGVLMCKMLHIKSLKVKMLSRFWFYKTETNQHQIHSLQTSNKRGDVHPRSHHPARCMRCCADLDVNIDLGGRRRQTRGQRCWSLRCSSSRQALMKR